MGLVRMRVLAHFFGVSALGDVWAAATKGPNIVQNLLGEQSLSAAFIPVYVRKLAAGEQQEAARFAGAILGLLLVLLSALALAGVLLAGPIVSVLNAGLLLDAEAVTPAFFLTWRRLVQLRSPPLKKQEIRDVGTKLRMHLTDFLGLTTELNGNHIRSVKWYTDVALAWLSAIAVTAAWDRVDG